MKKHLSEQQLIDFRFQLCAEPRRRDIEQHLAECAECRVRIEQLIAKFAALDSLKGDVSASEKLIADTLRTIRTSEPAPAMLFPRWAWVTGFAAAAALLMAVLYSGVMTGKQQPAAMAVAPKPAAPPIQVAVLKEQEAAPAAAGIEMDNMAMEELPAEGRLAFAPPRPVAKGIMAGRSMKSETMKLRSYAADAEQAAVHADWTSRSPGSVTVQVFPALLEFDEAVRKLPKDSGKLVAQWSISVSNRSDRASAAVMEKDFDTTNWEVRTSDPQVGVTTQNGTCARLTLGLPAQSAKSFTCTTIVQQEGEVP